MRRCARTVVWSVLVAALLARTVTRADEPVLPEDLRAALQFQPDDKKKPPDKKDKKPPPVAVADAVSFDSRLDLSDRDVPRAFEMLGDQPPPRGVQFIPVPVVVPVPAPGAPAQRMAILPGTRGFKVAENGSPRPQDRVYFSFSYFDDLHQDANRRAGSDIRNMRLYRETFGLEKTFFGGNASIDLRLPLNTLTVPTSDPNLNGSHTDIGDLGVILRYALYRDDELDNWFTAGLAVVAPTGSDTLGGIPAPAGPHSTVLQPFFGVLWNWGDLYVQGFSALDIPTDTSDVTFWLNDLGIGYFLYRAPEPDRVLTSFAPAFEVHVTTPLDHRGPVSAASPVGASDIVNLGLIGNFGIGSRGRLSVGVVTPVTGPKPFDIEALVQLRIRY